MPIQLDAEKRPSYTVIEIGCRVAGFVEEKEVNQKQNNTLSNYLLTSLPSSLLTFIKYSLCDSYYNKNLCTSCSYLRTEELKSHTILIDLTKRMVPANKPSYSSFVNENSFIPPSIRSFKNQLHA